MNVNKKYSNAIAIITQNQSICRKKINKLWVCVSKKVTFVFTYWQGHSITTTQIQRGIFACVLLRKDPFKLLLYLYLE